MDTTIWTNDSAMMASMDNPSLIISNVRNSKLISSPEFTTVELNETESTQRESFLLIDENEILQFQNSEEFVKRLGCDEDTKVKIVTIFGNTGDGKSYTLNECFFNGREVFRTSNNPDTCTIGIWAAYVPDLKIICMDTEGLLGSTNNDNRRTRLLLKVLAITDIIIYRTRSERLHSDLFTFLGMASRAYTQHFSSALTSVSQKAEIHGALSTLGSAVIIFHETRHTRVLKSTMVESAEDLLRRKFCEMKLDIEAFSSLRYIGVQTGSPPTNFTEICKAVFQELRNTTVRSPRKASIVFQALKTNEENFVSEIIIEENFITEINIEENFPHTEINLGQYIDEDLNDSLNDKFSGEIESVTPDMFPDQYFTCPAKCLSCESRCSNSMGHVKDGTAHTNSNKCKYQSQFNNCIYICKQCHTEGKETIVTPTYSTSEQSSWYSIAKYAWSG